jgi:hypothetical protein
VALRRFGARAAGRVPGAGCASRSAHLTKRELIW